VYNKVLL